MNRPEYALQLRVSLLEVLTAGEPACQHCGAAAELEALEIDHVDGRTWRWDGINFLDRIRRLWREYYAGVALRALCRRCNASEGTRRFRGRARYA